MSETRRHPNVVNLSEAEGRSLSHGTKFGCSMKHLGRLTGGRQIGCSWYEVEPGRTAFPRHYHCANEEVLFVLEGEGTLRIGGESVPLRAGDYVTFPVGPEHAHQTIATGEGPLRYLCFSTRVVPEVVGYPDSNKIGVSAAPSLDTALKGETWVRLLVPAGQSLGYYDGEDAG